MLRARVTNVLTRRDNHLVNATYFIYSHVLVAYVKMNKIKALCDIFYETSTNISTLIPRRINADAI